jgi:hypothetical protein
MACADFGCKSNKKIVEKLREERRRGGEEERRS